MPRPPVQLEMQDLLRSLVATGEEEGVQVAAYHRGQLVVDVAEGRLAPGGPPVTNRSLFPLFAISKGVTAACAHLQAQRGLLDLDAPIGSYWPEFATHGKGEVTARDALIHRTGVPQMPQGADFDFIADWERITGAIAALPPLVEPRTGLFYNAMTYGWIVAEAIRRSDPQRRPFEQFVAEEIAAPLRLEDFHMVVPDEAMDRVAVIGGLPYPEPAAGSPTRVGIPKALDLTPDVVNSPAMRRTVSPATGGFASALSTARFYAMLAEGGALDGVRLLSPQTVEAMWRERPDGRQPDPFLNRPAKLTEGGQVLGPAPVVGSGERVMFTVCAGGTYAWADPEGRLAVAILHNRMTMNRDPDTQPAWRIARLLRRSFGIAE